MPFCRAQIRILITFFNVSFSFVNSTTDLHIQGIECVATYHHVSWHYFNYFSIFLMSLR